MKKKSVLVVHNNMDFINNVRQYFLNGELYILTDYALDGEMLIKKGNLNEFDIVIIKNALTYVTGLYALETLIKKTKHLPDHMILITPFVNPFIQEKCEEYGIHYLKGSEIDIEKLPELLFKLELEKVNQQKVYFDSQKEVIKLLKQIGLLRTYTGYSYFEYVLNAMLDKADVIYQSMNTLYEMIASHFKVTKGSVEKAMRSCIKSSFLRNDSYYARMLFGHSPIKKEFPSTSIVLQVCIKTLKEQKNNIISNSMQNSLRKI